MKILKVFSVCSGVEGLGRPFSKNKRFKLVGFSEIDKDCIAVLRRNHPEVMNYGSLPAIAKRTKKLPELDVLIGGTPCQNLSMGGKREGLNGEQSRLFFDFVKILKRKRPRYFVWENVEGSLTSMDGWDFARVQVDLAEAGYSFRWEVLVGDEFAIPQARERVFIVGVLKGKGSRKVLSGKRRSDGDDKKKAA